MKKITAITIALLSVFSLASCAADDQARMEQVLDIRYTGDTRQDLSSLCVAGNFLNGLDNSQRAFIQNAVLDISDSYSQSQSPEVGRVVEGLRYLTSADQNLRNEGEQIIDTICGKI